MKIIDLIFGRRRRSSAKTAKRRLGDFGEEAAREHLSRTGYRIIATNFGHGKHEIDIIAKKGNVTAFIEVKTRTVGRYNPNEPRPASSVNTKKQQSIISAAGGYLSTHRVPTRKRFDIIEVYADRGDHGYKVSEIKHLEGAITLDTAFTQRR